MASKKRVEVSGSAERTALKHNPFDALGGRPPAVAGPPPAKGASPMHPPAATGVSHAGTTLRFNAKLVLRRESKGRGGKTVTRVTGIAAEQLEQVASAMKKKLGCGALVEGTDLLLLGDLVDRAAQWLQEHGATRVIKGN